MGYPTKVQVIRRASSEQWYVNFPAALAQAMDFTQGEIVEWTIEDRSELTVRRVAPTPSAKKKRRSASPARSTDSS